jgi:hypothetical protein
MMQRVAAQLGSRQGGNIMNCCGWANYVLGNGRKAVLCWQWCGAASGCTLLPTCRLMYLARAVLRTPKLLAVAAMSAGSCTLAAAAAASAWQQKQQHNNREAAAPRQHVSGLLCGCVGLASTTAGGSEKQRTAELTDIT